MVMFQSVAAHLFLGGRTGRGHCFPDLIKKAWTQTAITDGKDCQWLPETNDDSQPELLLDFDRL
jgi:hypothetical protein